MKTDAEWIAEWPVRRRGGDKAAIAGKRFAFIRSIQADALEAAAKEAFRGCDEDTDAGWARCSRAIARDIRAMKPGEGK